MKVYEAEESYETILVFTLQDGHKLAVRATTINTVADIQPSMDKDSNVVGGAVLHCGMARWIVRESVDEILGVWCPEDKGDYENGNGEVEVEGGPPPEVKKV